MSTEQSIPPKQRTIKNAKSVQKKSRSHEVTQLSPDRFQVKSGASGNTYDVTYHPYGPRCTCEWGAHLKDGQPALCSHVLSVQGFIAGQDGRTVSAWTSQEDAARQHRPTVQVGELYLTTRLAPSPIIWTIQSQKQDQARVLIPA